MFERGVVHRIPHHRWLRVWIAVVLTVAIFVGVEAASLYGASHGTPLPRPSSVTTMLRH